MKRLKQKKRVWGKKCENIWSSGLSGRARRKYAGITGKNRVRPRKGYLVTIWSHLVTPKESKVQSFKFKVEGGTGSLAKGE